jgi:hypothetical protein
VARQRPAWDIVSPSIDGATLLLGEAKWSATPFDSSRLGKAMSDLASRPPPSGGGVPREGKVLRVLFVPALDTGARAGSRGSSDPLIVTADELLAKG